jgi:hypothetical protein
MATTLVGREDVAARAAAPARQLHLANPLMTGKDVREAQELLLHNRYGKFDCGGVDGEYGPATAVATQDAKWLLGYTEPNCNGAFGPRLRGYLSGEEKLPADFAHRREVRLRSDGDKLVRNRIVQFALWGCRNEPSIHYEQSRPVEGLDHVKKLPLNTDCSGFVTLCYKWAGGPDPNGRHFRHGEAFTGFMISAGRRVAKSALKRGDLVVFGGPAKKQHVCVVIEPGANPTLVSHGQERGPFKVSFSAEQHAHADQPVFWLSYLR